MQADEFRRWENRADLLAHLSGAPRSLLLDGDSGSSQIYLSQTVDTPNGSFELGLAVEFHGIHPSAIWVPASARVFVGYEAAVAIIDAERAEVESTVSLGLFNLFYEFLFPDVPDMVLACNEFGTTALSTRGTVLWSADLPDIVSGARLHDGALFLRQLETGDEVAFDLLTGRRRPDAF